MNWVDFAILAVIALSAIIGFFRGFLREIIGLASWVLAFYIAFISAEAAAPWFQQWVSSDSIRIGVAFAVIFILVLIVGAIVSWIFGKLVDNTGLAGTDRIVGAGFGVVRGVAILVLLVMLAGMTPLPQDNWWQQSMFMHNLRDGAVYVRDKLPQRFAQAIVYPSDKPRSEDAAAAQPAQVINVPVDKITPSHTTN